VADSPELVNRKAALRAVLLGGRASRSPQARADAADAVAAVLADRLAGAAVVAGHLPAAEEPGHGRLLGALPGRVLLPVVPARGRELAWAEHDGRLALGRFGLLEPAGPRQPAAALATADVVVVPALAVAADGTRLGRGGGYYDRALAHARPGAVLVAVVFDEELLDAVPAGPHDRRMTAVVSPSAGWRQLG
jgi:5-formyltetrahydrofolate cyclo-ligase